MRIKAISNIDEAKSRSAHKRIELLDIVRGVAIIGVVFYHAIFDLRLVEFIQLDVTVHPGWVVFARILSGSFLVLTGISLVLSHGEIVRWGSFLRRFSIIIAAAIGISIATYLAFPDMFVYFGILHAIAIFSVMAIPFLRAPLWLVGAVMLAIIATPFFVSSSIFNDRIFSWVGLWTVPPLTGDLVPIFPSFGLTLGGLFLARIIIKMQLVSLVASFVAKGGFMRFLAAAGRWSLLIYLLHQPILLGILFPVSSLTKPAELSKEAAFYGACFGNCLETSGNASQCKKYCQCSLEQVGEGDLWEIVNSPFLTKEQSQVVTSVSNLCSAMTADMSED